MTLPLALPGPRSGCDPAAGACTYGGSVVKSEANAPPDPRTTASTATSSSSSARPPEATREDRRMAAAYNDRRRCRRPVRGIFRPISQWERRVNELYQFGTQVSPPSNENAWFHFGQSVVVSDHSYRTLIGLPSISSSA